MTDERFNNFWPRLLKYEGGYVNDPVDPGGETKYGISKRSYPNLDIKNLTEVHAKEIYLRDYYFPLRISEIVDDRIAWQLFDFAVNAGIGRSVKIIQKIIGVPVTERMTPLTINQINLFKDEYPLYAHFMSKRLMHYFILSERKPAMKKFIKGWIFRTMEL